MMPKKNRQRTCSARSRCLVWLISVLILAPPAGADWLITLEGKLIETQGPWTIDGRTLTYTDLEGEQQTLDVDDVDLEASEETTALKAGKPYVPRDEAEASSEAVGKKRKGRSGKGKRRKPKVILYTATLCRECTKARELLEELGVDFVEKDINASIKARREYNKKAGHGGGLPVIDIDGYLVFSNNPRVIRQRVWELKEREEAAASGDDPSAR